MTKGRHQEYLARHRRALLIGVPVLGSIGMFLIFGGFAAGWGNVFAAGVLAVSLWIGMKLVLAWLALRTPASHDIAER